MRENTRQIPPLAHKHVDLSTKNRFEDQQHPVRLQPVSTDRWIEQVRNYGNKTQTSAKEFNTHMEDVRKRTEEELRLGTFINRGDRSRSPGYDARRQHEHRKKHLHLYSNRRDKSPHVYSNRYISQPPRDQERLRSVQNTRNYRGATQNQESQQEQFAQGKVTKKIRYKNDRGEDIEEFEQINFNPDSNGIPRMSDAIRTHHHGQQAYSGMPKMSDALRSRQQNGTFETQQIIKYRSKHRHQGNESVFKRLHDKAQNVYSNLNGQTKFGQGDQEQIQFNRGQTQDGRHGSSATPRMVSRGNELDEAEYYKPQGQRIIDQRFQQIRRRTKQIDPRGFEPGPTLGGVPIAQSIAQVNRSVDLRMNPIREKQQEFENMLAENTTGLGRQPRNENIIDQLRGKQTQFRQIIEAETSRTQLAEAPLRPGINSPTGINPFAQPPRAGISSTQPGTLRKTQFAPGGTTVAQSAFRTVPPSQFTEETKQLPQALQVLNANSKQFNQLINRQVEQTAANQQRQFIQGKQLTDVLFPAQSNGREQMPQIIKQINGAELTKLINRQTADKQNQLPQTIATKFEGKGQQLQQVINKSAEGRMEMPGSIKARFQGKGKQLQQLIQRETAGKQQPNFTSSDQFPSDSEGLIPKANSNKVPNLQVIRQTGNPGQPQKNPGGAPMPNLMNSGSNFGQMPQILKDLQGKKKELAQLINKQTQHRKPNSPELEHGGGSIIDNLGAERNSITKGHHGELGGYLGQPNSSLLVKPNITHPTIPSTIPPMMNPTQFMNPAPPRSNLHIYPGMPGMPGAETTTINGVQTRSQSPIRTSGLQQPIYYTPPALSGSKAVVCNQGSYVFPVNQLHSSGQIPQYVNPQQQQLLRKSGAIQAAPGCYILPYNANNSNLMIRKSGVVAKGPDQLQQMPPQVGFPPGTVKMTTVTPTGPPHPVHPHIVGPSTPGVISSSRIAANNSAGMLQSPGQVSNLVPQSNIRTSQMHMQPPPPLDYAMSNMQTQRRLVGPAIANLVQGSRVRTSAVGIQQNPQMLVPGMSGIQPTSTLQPPPPIQKKKRCGGLCCTLF